MAAKTIDAYIEGLTDWRGDAVRQIRELVDGAAPDAESSIKWAQPVLAGRRWAVRLRQGVPAVGPGCSRATAIG